jgi:hypothetical protein
MMAAISKGRYMPVDIFALCVAAASVAISGKTLERNIERLVVSYRGSYPSEGPSLKADIEECAEEVIHELSTLVDASGAVNTLRRQEDVANLTILVTDELVKQGKARRNRLPLLKRIFVGARWNYSPTPILDRRKRAVATIRFVILPIMADAIARKAKSF